MNFDEQLLAGTPDFFSINTLLKATPHQEGGDRFIYFEASNEGVDQQNEKVLAKALEDSASHFLKFGNIDIDHYTLIGARAGIPNPMSYEIGRPVDVRIEGDKTFVKAQLYSGNTELAANANMVWESMTALNPPARWYPSVGGAVLAKSVEIDPATKNKVAVVKRVRWTNVGLSRTPVNQHLPEASALPVATFAKSLQGFVIAKALEASYATDAAMKTGGAALGIQSLDTGVPHSYFDFRERMAAALKSGKVQKQTMEGLIDYASKQFSLQPDEAAEWVDRFLSDLKSSLSTRSKQ